MNAKVIVCADEAGNVIRKSKSNPDYGTIRVKQTRLVVDENSGFVRKRELSALIPGEIETLSMFGWEDGEHVSGQILIKESLSPFNADDPDRDLKIAGDTGVVCCQDGQPIYRKHVFTFNLKSEDELVEHTNGDAIKAAYAAQKENDPLTKVTGEDFSM
jgi:hypothetical protein